MRSPVGGGAIQDVVTRILNLSEWLVGPISRLCVDAQHQRLADVFVEDTVHVLARHGNVMGSYMTNMYQHPNETSITVVCEQGTVRFEANNHRWRCMTDTEGKWQDWQHKFAERDDSYIQIANVLLDYLESDSTPPATLRKPAKRCG